MIIFYVLYFSWLFLVAFLWPNPKTLTLFLLGILVFYFGLLYEKFDIWFFLIVVASIWLVGKYLAEDPLFANRGIPPLGIPFWPIAWGITSLALRKFYLTLNKGAEPRI